MKHLILAAVVGLALCGPGRAAEDAEKYAIAGVGTISCAVWLEERANKSSEARVLMSWVHGYISAHNEYKEDVNDVIEGLDVPSLESWIDTHCAAHSKDDLHTSTEALIKHFESRP